MDTSHVVSYIAPFMGTFNIFLGLIDIIVTNKQTKSLREESPDKLSDDFDNFISATVMLTIVSFIFYIVASISNYYICSSLIIDPTEIPPFLKLYCIINIVAVILATIEVICKVVLGLFGISILLLVYIILSSLHIYAFWKMKDEMLAERLERVDEEE
ncbi:unnamed protein product [Chironomus riparius]|uniref:Uncharacterized protein n=1 Tax=Chironomus riparius TaxID=315576 RepID=A0A9N9S2I4_9DIPT|nr:unnamed protein product [Chironomus riparius]